MIGRSFFATIQIFFSITPALVYLVAGWVINGDPAQTAITAGTIVAFTTLQSRLFFPVGQMLQVTVEVQSATALFERIYEYLDMPLEIEDAPDAVALDPAKVAGTGPLPRTSRSATTAPRREDVPTSPVPAPSRRRPRAASGPCAGSTWRSSRGSWPPWSGRAARARRP